MATAKQLVRSLRSRHGLSQAALAKRAGCPTSTVARIETNRLDPTLTSLQRLFAACGERFPGRRAAQTETPSLAALAAQPRSIDDLDWTALRGLVDWLQSHPDQMEDAVREPVPQRNEVLSNLFAAVAEKLADDRGLPHPDWVASIHALPEPWRPSGTARMQDREAKAAPRQFRKRNLLLSGANLWRDATAS